MSVALQPSAWPGRRWLISVLVIFAAQLGLIFGLSDRAPLRVRPADKGPPIRIAGPASAEVLALEDPTLFALPHRRVFSGPAWMKTPEMPSRSFFWPEESRPLLLGVGELGTAFNHFMATNLFNPFPTLTVPRPELALPKMPALDITSGSSSLRIEGALARRRLLTPVVLHSWAHTEILTNSIVQIVVNSEGHPVTKVLLRPGSGSDAADKEALEHAQTARFEPIEDSAGPLGHLTLGKLIFDWKTIPAPNTNSSLPSPAPR